MKKIGERLVESVLAGRRVSNYSTEWKEECEIAFLSGLKEPLLESMLVGAVGNSDSIKAKRGAAEVERLRTGIARYRQLKGVHRPKEEARG